jgi:hypothetical protein
MGEAGPEAVIPLARVFNRSPQVTVNYTSNYTVNGGDADSVRATLHKSENDFLERVKRAFKNDFRRSFA